MTASLKILVPEATVNFIENPSFRYNTTGWYAVGATVSRTLDRSRFGIASLKVVAPGTITHEGVYYRVNYLNGTNDKVTASAYVRGIGFIRIRLTDNASGKEWASSSVPLRDERWTRVEITGRCEGGNDVRLYIETPSKASATFYVDGAQMEIKPYSTSYCDGSQEGCRWEGKDNASFSLRNIYTRDGGRWATVIGDDPRLENIYATMTTGFGMESIVNNKTSFIINPGGSIVGIKKTERLLSLVFHAKNRDLSRQCDRELSLGKLHELRQMFIDIIKPDAVGGNQPFWMEYQDGDIPMRLKAYYDGGLEGDWDIRNQWVMDFPLRLLATTPFFLEDNQQSATFDYVDTALFSGVAGRVDGEWKNMNGGIYNNYNLTDFPLDNVDGTIKDLKLGDHGEMYAVGRFKKINYNGILSPNAVADCAAYWDGYKWTAF